MVLVPLDRYCTNLSTSTKANTLWNNFRYRELKLRFWTENSAFIFNGKPTSLLPLAHVSLQNIQAECFVKKFSLNIL